jgi:hypothetical protein
VSSCFRSRTTTTAKNIAFLSLFEHKIFGEIERKLFRPIFFLLIFVFCCNRLCFSFGLRIGSKPVEENHLMQRMQSGKQTVPGGTVVLGYVKVETLPLGELIS